MPWLPKKTYASLTADAKRRVEEVLFYQNTVNLHRLVGVEPKSMALLTTLSNLAGVNPEFILNLYNRIHANPALTPTIGESALLYRLRFKMTNTETTKITGVSAQKQIYYMKVTTTGFKPPLMTASDTEKLVLFNELCTRLKINKYW